MTRDVQLSQLLDSNGDVKSSSLDNVTVDATAVSSSANAATDFFALPKGTTAQRPSSPENGYIRYNTTENLIEEWRSSAWVPVSNVFSASGGTVTEAGGYKYHTFTSSGTFEVSSGTANIEYLIAAGGGAGGDGQSSGGGGAGGAIDGSALLSAGTYPIVIGAGGSGRTGQDTYGTNSNSGSNSTFNGNTALGGGGSNSDDDGTSGGSGGGGGTRLAQRSGGSGTTGQGNRGGHGVYNAGNPRCGGGGGGAAAVGASSTGGTRGGAGGNGINWKSLGTYYAGGGGGATDSANGGVGGDGGLGGGGAGGGQPAVGTAGSANTGGGGGSGGYSGSIQRGGASGGSGIVIIRYPA